MGEANQKVRSRESTRAEEKNETRPFRIAVVGGGCAGVTAAWEIASCEGFEVDLFEQSWRLGGKGASGRLDDGRIREHGLHLWLGFYENAFGLMRECYGQVESEGWGPGSNCSAPLAHGSIDDAFIAEPHIGVGTTVGESGFSVWDGYFAPEPGLPGLPLDPRSNPFTPASYLVRCLDLLKTLIQSTFDADRNRFEDAALFFREPTTEAQLERIRTLLSGSLLTAASALNVGLAQVQRWLDSAKNGLKKPAKVLDLLTAMASITRAQLSDVAAVDPGVRAKTELIDMVLAIAVGLYRDRLLFRKSGFDAINHLDYRDWLEKHGASEAARHSRFLAGIYEFAFAFEGGDPKKPSLAAGVALRSALRMFFTYRGAMFWRLRSGMGDTIFAPLYRALLAGRVASEKHRGRSPVRVNLMHRLRSVDVEPAQDGELYVSRLRFDVAGDPSLISSRHAVALDMAGCWPDDDALLVASGGDGPGTRELAVDTDFDAVVFAVGIDDLRVAFSDSANSANVFSMLPKHWKKMSDSVTTVATKAAQLWLDEDFTTLGWDSRPGVVTSLGMTFETVADMTHTLASERSWRRAMGIADSTLEGARSVAYFCSVLPDVVAATAIGSLERLVRQDLDILITSDARRLWPDGFVHDTGVKSHVLDASIKANAHLSDRYTQSLPNTIEQRISPLDRSVANMTIAGDWTACGLDAGCVEAAVMSGLLASHAITGKPGLSSIAGYIHP